MCENSISLNGMWKMDYHSNAPCRCEEEPRLVWENAVSAPVPGYWEDMTDLFRTTALLDLLSRGNRVVLFGAGPFACVDASWQLSVAGRTNGHLATVIDDHPLMDGFPHEGYCGERLSPCCEAAGRWCWIGRECRIVRS